MEFKPGILLKKRRQRKGLNLEQIYEVTKISTDILRNIEEGKDLPAPVILKNFIKLYARALNMNEESLLQDLEKCIEKPEKKNPIPIPKESHSFNILKISLVSFFAVTFFFILFNNTKIKEESVPQKQNTIPLKKESVASFKANSVAPSESFFSFVKQDIFNQELIIQSSEKGKVYVKLDDLKLTTQILEPKKWYGFKALRKIYVRVQDDMPINVIHNGKWKIQNASQAFEQIFE